MVLNFGFLKRSVEEALSPSKDALTNDWQWIVDNGTLKLLDGEVTNGTTTLYTVPAGKIFYMISMNLSSKETNSSTGAVNGKAAGIVFIANVLQANDTFNYSGSFPIPIKLTAGQTIQVISYGANIYGALRVQGYEVSA